LRAQGMSENEALELVETVDRDRSEYIKKYFDIEWPSRAYFHLMVNSEIGDEFVIQTILGSVALLDKQR